MISKASFMGLYCVLSFIVACDRSKPPIQIFPDMDDQQKVSPQAEDPFFVDKKSLQEPVEGTIARGQKPYPFPLDPEEASKKLKNPLPLTSDTLSRGQFMFNVHCMPCHNSDGQGFGPVIKRGFAPPPPLASDKVKNWTDGKIFHVITVGQGIMPTYAPQVDPIDRWAIILYIRALQKAHDGLSKKEPQ